MMTWTIRYPAHTRLIGTVGTGGGGGGTGPPGADGNTVLNGSGAPAGGTGSNGDFYIDTDEWDIYGPKAGGAWGSGTSLIGPPGGGGGGAAVLYGVGAPDNGDGNDGDLYIETTLGVFYVKVTGAWTSVYGVPAVANWAISVQTPAETPDGSRVTFTTDEPTDPGLVLSDGFAVNDWTWDAGTLTLSSPPISSVRLLLFVEAMA